MLRPEGFVIIRDTLPVVNHIRKFLKALQWDGWVSEVEPRGDALSLTVEERVLIAKRKCGNRILRCCEFDSLKQGRKSSVCCWSSFN